MCEYCQTTYYVILCQYVYKCKPVPRNPSTHQCATAPYLSVYVSVYVSAGELTVLTGA